MQLIEFVGMPRAGKTTQIERLKSRLEAQGSEVAVLTDRARAASITVPPTEGLAYTLVFFAQAIDFYYRQSEEVDYLLIDRGFNDVAVWADVRRAMGEISDQEAASLELIFERFKRLVDRTFFFDLSVQTSLKRHGSAEHQAVDKVAMKAEWLEALRSSYLRHASSFRNSTRINGELDAESMESLIRDGLQS